MPQFRLIAPSGCNINQEAAQQGVQRLLEMGHQVENQTIIPRRMQRFAGAGARLAISTAHPATLEGENTIVLAIARRLWRKPAAGEHRLEPELAARQQQDPLLTLRTQRFHGDPARPACVAPTCAAGGRCWPATGAPELDAFTQDISGATCENPTFTVSGNIAMDRTGNVKDSCGAATSRCWCR